MKKQKTNNRKKYETKTCPTCKGKGKIRVNWLGQTLKEEKAIKKIYKAFED